MDAWAYEMDRRQRHRHVHRGASFVAMLSKGAVSMLKKAGRAYQQRQKGKDNVEFIKSDSVRILEFIEPTSFADVLPPEECQRLPQGMPLPEVILEDRFKAGMCKLHISLEKQAHLVEEFRYRPEIEIDEFLGRKSFQEMVEHQLDFQEEASLATMKAMSGDPVFSDMPQISMASAKGPRRSENTRLCLISGYLMVPDLKVPDGARSQVI